MVLIGAHATAALNKGAHLGEFAHDTGEGGISEYHRKFNGDLIWEIGTGYFGCRTDDGHFDETLFAEQAILEQVKMIEIKLSQGAKPGKGGMLPGEKVTSGSGWCTQSTCPRGLHLTTLAFRIFNTC